MAAGRFLIVNADDFGQSPGINRGVAEAHERGIVTSASLMVRWPAAAEAAAYARAHPDLSLGLHLDFGEWAYRDGAWFPLYTVVPTDDAAAVADEVARQLATFRTLAGRDPTHLDTHQHAHGQEPVRSIVRDLARQLGVPLRGAHPAIRYSGAFYGQSGRGEPYPEGITVAHLVEVLAALPPGVTELGCHPGFADDLDSPYRHERAVEVRTLCDRHVRAAIAAHDVLLCPFPMKSAATP
jgi:predicted glycoside hydrolase/deacetylase ChbG (UPF0249 family)